MKKLKLLFAALIFLSGGLKAQSIHLGLKGGIGFSEVNYSNIDFIGGLEIKEVFEPIISYSLNGVFELVFTENLSYRIEPGLILKGNKDNQTDTKLVQYHIQIPNVLRVGLGERFFLDFGIESSILVYDRAGDRDSDFFDLFENRLEYGALLGLGFHKNRSYEFGARINRSINSFSTFNLTDITGSPVGRSNASNQYVQIYFQKNIFSNTLVKNEVDE